MLAPLSVIEHEVLLLVRIIFGLTFLYYGWPKVKNLRANANDFVKMGFSPGWLWGTIVAFLEFFGSLAVMLGLYVWAWSLMFVVHMVVGTVWKATKTAKPFSDWSYDLLLLSLALLLLTFGPGAYTLAAVL